MAVHIVIGCMHFFFHHRNCFISMNGFVIKLRNILFNCLIFVSFKLKHDILLVTYSLRKCGTPQTTEIVAVVFHQQAGM